MDKKEKTLVVLLNVKVHQINNKEAQVKNVG